MPWHVAKTKECPTSKPYGVIKTADGSISGCHVSATHAHKQLAALYANESDPVAGLQRAIAALPSVSVKELQAQLKDTLAALGSKTRRDGLIRDFRQGQGALENDMTFHLRPKLSQLGAHVAGVANAVGGLKEAVSPIAGFSSDAEAQIAHVVTLAQLGTWANVHLQPIFEAQWGKTAYRTAVAIERRYGFGLNADEIANKMLQQGGKRVGLLDLNADTKQALFNVLSKAHEQGIGVRKVGRMIADMVPEGRFVDAGAGYRGELIARTETLNAQRMGSIESYYQSQAVQKVVAYDGLMDELCADRNGNVYTLDEAVSESGDTHPNCILAWGPVV